MEIDQGLLTKVKTYLRISHTKLDDDVADSISACLADLRVCGVRTIGGHGGCDRPLVLQRRQAILQSGVYGRHGQGRRVHGQI